MKTLMNQKAVYNPTLKDIELTDAHNQILTFNQLQQIVRQANVEYGMKSNKGFSYHLFEGLYQFNRKEAINFLMVGVGEIFFDTSKELALSLVGKYFLGDYIKNAKH